MNEKRYRAATMRDALEKIKGELGDEALVLGSKEIRSKGFLGLGAKDLVEVRVSTEFAGATEAKQGREKKSASRKSGFTSLSLSESTPATPAFSSLARERNSGAMSTTLEARANVNDSETQTELPANQKALGQSINLSNARVKENNSIKANAESATATAATAREQEPVAGASSSAAPRRDFMAVELERLRAEVREVKFTLTRPTPRNLDMVAGAHSLQDFSDADSEIYDSPFYETYLHLASLGLPPAMCRAAVRMVIATGPASKDIQTLAHDGLVKALSSFVKFGDSPLVESKSAGNQSVLALVGPTGVGKTTTIAKLAARAALRERRRVELITLDTYRIAAVDQLRTYAEIIGAGFHVPRSVLELDALIQRFPKETYVLIDTIGRSARDLADQLELADYLRLNEDISKCLVLQATTHPTDALLAINKFALFGSNKLVVTKLDETSRPGSAIATAAESDLPLVYLCGGQRVPEDIENATPQSLASHVLQSTAMSMAA